MKTVLLAQDGEEDAPSAHRCRLGDRWHARISAFRLDRALAAGASPDSGLLLSLRAEALISMDNRRRLARLLRRVVTDAGRPMHPLGALPLACRGILRHRDLIDAVAGALERPGPVDLRGLAAVEVLLRDGAGPLYNDDRFDALGGRLEWVLRMLSSPPAGSTIA